MGGFLSMGGASWKRDRAETLNAFGDLRNVFNFALPAAKQASGAGQGLVQQASGDLGQAGGYYSKLLSGNRTALQGAVAPETNAVLSEAEGQKRQLAASGTARGGGVAGAEQQQKDATMAKIDNLLFGVRPGAAEGLTKVGAVKGALAGTELATATNMLGLGERAASNLGSLAIGARKDDYAINQDMVAKTSQAILNVMAAFAV